MEFKHRKELSEPPFNLVLSDTELWDLIRAGRLQPFKKVDTGMGYLLTDPLSRDPAYEPLFPRPIAEKYKWLRCLQQRIDDDQKVIDKSEDDAWKDHQKFRRFDYYGQTVLVNKDTSEKTKDLDFERKLERAGKETFLTHFRGVKKKILLGHSVTDIDSGSTVEIQSLEANKKEAAELEQEFKDLPKLYQAFIKNIASDREREDFVREFNDAHFRRDEIEGVIKTKITEDLAAALEPTGEPVLLEGLKQIVDYLPIGLRQLERKTGELENAGVIFKKGGGWYAYRHLLEDYDYHKALKKGPTQRKNRHDDGRLPSLNY